MNFLLDTNVISEPKQKKPDKKVLEWLGAQDESKIYLSVVIIGEIRKGITRLESGKKKTELEAWLEKLTAVASSASAGTTIFAVLVRLNMDHSLITLLVY